MEDVKVLKYDCPLQSSEVRLSSGSEAEKDYPETMVGNLDVKVIRHTPDLHKSEHKELVSPDKDDRTLQSEYEETMIADFLKLLSSSPLEEQLNSELPPSPKQDHFEPSKEENLSSSLVPFPLDTSETRQVDVSPHYLEESASSSLDFFADNVSKPFASTSGAKNSNYLLQSDSIECKVDMNRGVIDTRAPFESVRAAVSKFGGILDWKAHRAQTMERRKLIEEELSQAQEGIPIYKKQYQDSEVVKIGMLKELDSTKRLIEELKLNLERAQTEEQQAKQDLELAILRVEELERGVGDEASVSAKAQLEVARSRHIAADTELNLVRKELEQLHRDYDLLVSESDKAIKGAEKAVAASREAEKLAEDLTIELMDVKECLRFAHGAHLEAEEGKIGAGVDREREFLKCGSELKAVEEEKERLEQKILSKKVKKSKLDMDAALLMELKSALAAYIESKQKLDSEREGLMKELEEVKVKIDKGFVEVNCLKMEEASLKLEMERERSEVIGVGQREEMASALATSLEGELSMTKSAISSLQLKERETRERMAELPMQLQNAGQESDEARLFAQMAHEEWQKEKDDLEKAKAEVNAMECRLISAQKEVEAAKASEKLALAAINALKESEEELAQSDNDGDSREGIITLSLEEYYELSKQAHEAEERANAMMASAASQIEEAKESESRTLKKLEKVGFEMTAQKEALVVAIHKAEKAKEGKILVEQELRAWRSENKQRRETGECVDENRNPRLSFESGNLANNFIQLARSVVPQNGNLHGNNAEIDSAAEGKGTKKKKSFFPRIFMLLARRKAHTNKSR